MSVYGVFTYVFARVTRVQEIFHGYRFRIRYVAVRVFIPYRDLRDPEFVNFGRGRGGEIYDVKSAVRRLVKSGIARSVYRIHIVEIYAYYFRLAAYIRRELPDLLVNLVGNAAAYGSHRVQIEFVHDVSAAFVAGVSRQSGFDIGINYLFLRNIDDGYPAFSVYGTYVVTDLYIVCVRFRVICGINDVGIEIDNVFNARIGIDVLEFAARRAERREIHDVFLRIYAEYAAKQSDRGFVIVAPCFSGTVGYGEHVAVLVDKIEFAYVHRSVTVGVGQRGIHEIHVSIAVCVHALV